MLLSETGQEAPLAANLLDIGLSGLWSALDLVLFGTFLTIALASTLILRRRGGLGNRSLAVLLISLLVLSAINQGLGYFSQSFPVHWVSLLVKLALALVSLAAACALIQLLLKPGQISVAEHEDETITRLEVAIADLAHARSALERRVKLRSEELDHANAQIVATARDAVQGSRDLIQLVSILLRPGAEASQNPESFLRELRGRINALSAATAAVMERGDGATTTLDRVIRRQFDPLFANPRDHLVTDGPPLAIGTQGALQLSLVAWELASRFARMPRSRKARGRIAVTWSVAGNPQAGDALELEWRETFRSSSSNGLDRAVEGDGTYTPEPLADFSETLLIRTIPHLLDGKGRINIAASTFIYRLTCPIGALGAASKPVSVLPEEERGHMPRAGIGSD